MKVNAKNLKSLILEVIKETEMLEEGWKDHLWDPSYLARVLKEIESMTERGDNAQHLISKYLLASISDRWRALGPSRLGQNYRRILMNLSKYKIDNEELSKVVADFANDGRVGFGAYVIESKEEKQIREKDPKAPKPLSIIENDQAIFRTILKEKGNEAALRRVNKMIKRYDKRIIKFFTKNSKLDKYLKGFQDSLHEHLDKLAEVQFIPRFRDLIPIMDFINAGDDDSNLQKLEAFHKNFPQKDSDKILEKTVDWIEAADIKRVSCDDIEPGASGCIYHQFHNGLFWYNLNKNMCDVSGKQMSNCGQASRSDSTLFNLMSFDKNNKPTWLVMLEYDPSSNEIAQVLGKRNEIPKKEHWEYIKWFSEHYKAPIYRDAFEHANENPMKIDEFYEYMQPEEPFVPKFDTRSWEAMREQIQEGLYNNEFGEESESDDMVTLLFASHKDQELVDVMFSISMRIADRDYVNSGMFEEKDFPAMSKGADRLSKQKKIGRDFFSTAGDGGIPKSSMKQASVDISEYGFISILISMDIAHFEGTGELSRKHLSSWMKALQEKYDEGYSYAFADKVRASVKYEAQAAEVEESIPGWPNVPDDFPDEKDVQPEPIVDL